MIELMGHAGMQVNMYNEEELKGTSHLLVWTGQGKEGRQAKHALGHWPRKKETNDEKIILAFAPKNSISCTIKFAQRIVFHPSIPYLREAIESNLSDCLTL